MLEKTGHISLEFEAIKRYKVQKEFHAPNQQNNWVVGYQIYILKSS